MFTQTEKQYISCTLRTLLLSHHSQNVYIYISSPSPLSIHISSSILPARTVDMLLRLLALQCNQNQHLKLQSSNNVNMESIFGEALCRCRFNEEAVSVSGRSAIRAIAAMPFTRKHSLVSRHRRRNSGAKGLGGEGVCEGLEWRWRRKSCRCQSRSCRSRPADSLIPYFRRYYC
jgi:hypothetical protein